MRILVTGSTGFAGGHLAEALVARGGTAVSGLSRRGEWPADLRHLAERVELYPCDLGDRGSVEAVLRHTNPQQIYHLAGYSHANKSVQESDQAWAGNLTATRILYEAIQRWGGKPRVLYVGSGMVYADPERDEQPLNESWPQRPATPYAASKAAADLLSQWSSPALDIVRVRPFNHIGPRQSPEFAIAHFAQQIAAIEKGQRQPVVATGNLTPRRDLTDVRDMVQAYLLIMQHGRSGDVYNVGTGVTYTMKEVLDRLLAQARARIEVRQDAERVRAVEPAGRAADVAKLCRETGWQRRYILDQTLADTLEYWRTAK